MRQRDAGSKRAPAPYLLSTNASAHPNVPSPSWSATISVGDGYKDVHRRALMSYEEVPCPSCGKYLYTPGGKCLSAGCGYVDVEDGDRLTIHLPRRREPVHRQPSRSVGPWRRPSSRPRRAREVPPTHEEWYRGGRELGQAEFASANARHFLRREAPEKEFERLERRLALAWRDRRTLHRFAMHLEQLAWYLNRLPGRYKTSTRTWTRPDVAAAIVRRK